MRNHARTHHDAPLPFPEGFLWGSGTSAHQVEGENRLSDWWAFEEQGRVARGERSGRACEHYRRYAEDFALAEELGHTAYKLSIEWARVEPEPGRFDADVLEHYAVVLRELRSRGIEPFVTLHHFTNPRWLTRAGGWLDPDAPGLFTRYAGVVADRLGGLVHRWITINEPMLLALYGYGKAFWPPERKGWRSGYRAARGLARAHRGAYAAIVERLPAARVGVAVNAAPLVLSDRPELSERVLSRPFDWLANHYFLDAVRGSMDFIGLQYYSRATVRQLLFADVHARPFFRSRLARSDLGWEIYPRGLYDAVMRVWRRHGLPVYVTENGVADAGDSLRTAFVHDHLWWLRKAIEDGAQVRGYLHWALLDNFEWLEGFAPRFGLVEVDYTTQERRIRPSARYYAQVCRTNALQPVPAAVAAMLEPVPLRAAE
ncbi:MAG: glycoside hydrolase family 1 protein [Coriobacteriia bacterium]|nr:glycoside hydrolase family 1 protein [Coriobacteriia bacterium]